MQKGKDADLTVMVVLCVTFGLIFTAFDAWMIAAGRPGQGFYIYPVVFFIFAAMFVSLKCRQDRRKS